MFTFVKFIYSEEATKFCEIFTLFLTVSTVVKSKVKILQNFVAFSEYMKFSLKNVGSHTYKSEKKSGETLKKIWVDAKGQLILKGLFCVFNSYKKVTKNFCPSWVGQKLKFSRLFFGRKM